MASRSTEPDTHDQPSDDAGPGESGSLAEAVRAIHMLQDEAVRTGAEIAELHDQLEASRRFAADQADRRSVEKEQAVRELEDRRIVAESLLTELDALRHEVRNLTRRLADADEELGSRRRELEAIRTSRSFRLAEGLRSAYDGTRAFLGR